MGKVNSGIPQIPAKCKVNLNSQESNWRQSLPIWAQKSEILQSISQNQVTLITGDTGSGKTTQVPQYILEHAAETGTQCRIVCAEPRRLAAVAVAERVANEREEEVSNYMHEYKKIIFFKFLLFV